jgi:hypothetical protein
MDYEEVQHEQEVSSIKSHKTLWFLFFGIIFIIIVVSLFLIFTPGGSDKVSNKELMEGASLDLEENDSVGFKFGDEDHGIKIDFVGLDYAGITISSEPINLILQINEARYIDFNNDEIYDIKVKLIKIENGTATVAVKRLYLTICEEKWNCTAWSECSNGNQTRECGDLNNCGTTIDKLVEERECFNIEFVEEDSYFEDVIKKNLNNSTGIGNLTNATTASNTANNLTNNTNTATNNHTNATTANNHNNTTGVNNSLINSTTGNNHTNGMNIINNSNGINTTICPSGKYACYESQGFFCRESYASGSIDFFCCSNECLRFNSKEQFCDVRGYFYFEGNETYICKNNVHSPFNGTYIICCGGIISKSDVGLSSTH